MNRAPVQPIVPEDIITLLPALVTEGQSASELIIACMDALLTLGFDNARYYEIDEHDPERGRICVLTHQAHQVQQDNYEVGYTIPWRDTALHQLGNGRAVVCANHQEMKPEPAWVKDLGLRFQASIDIPVVAGEEILGLLAADCSPERLQTGKGLSVFLALGAIAGSASMTERMKARQPIELGKRPSIETSPDEYAADVAVDLMRAVDADAAALFHFDWRRKRLIKVRQWLNDREADVGDFPEEYRIGEHLTGIAWRDPAMRYVPDFSKLLWAKPRLVNRKSFDYHTERLGHPLKTVLYTVLGRNEPRYLVRVFNRRSDPTLPFMSLKDKFDSLSNLHSIGLDDLIARRRLHHVARTARAGVKNVTRPYEVVKQGLQPLQDEGLRDFFFVCKLEGAQRPVFVYAAGVYGDVENRIGGVELPDSTVIKHLAEQPGFALTGEALLRYAPGLGELVHSVKAETHSGSEQYACFTSEAGQVASIFLARVPAAVAKKSPLVTLPEPALEAVQVLVALFTEAVDSKFSYLSARGARHALGYIGHELGTPLAILGDTAIAAIVRTLEDIAIPGDIPRDRAGVLRSRLREYYRRVQDSRGAANSALRLAPLVVQVGEGYLPLFISPESVGVIAEAAARQVMSKDWRQGDIGSSRREGLPRVRIDVHPSVYRLGSINCDSYLLRQLLVNVLDNAVKYSMPRGGKQEMTVSVSGQPSGQNHVLLSVQNWGEPVNVNNADAIFEAFVRGEKEERQSAIRGMGLGLYLARLIATAHRGTLDLRRSRLATAEGKGGTEGRQASWTTFDLRLPRSLEVGPSRFTYRDGQRTFEKGY